ncbi:hypothetical protein ACLB2K_033951 [Fragaria x ananassa]
MMRPSCLLLLSLLLFASLQTGFGDHSRMFPRRVIDEAEVEEILAGMGPQRVNNINDAHLKEIAEFAVSEFNKESLKSLVFHKVISGLVQLVEGDLYALVIAVRDESLPASPIVNYQCRVQERVWLDDPLELISFHQVFYDTVISMVWNPAKIDNRYLFTFSNRRPKYMTHDKEHLNEEEEQESSYLDDDDYWDEEEEVSAFWGLDIFDIEQREWLPEPVMGLAICLQAKPIIVSSPKIYSELQQSSQT